MTANEIRAGKLRHRVQLLSITPTQDKSGGIDETATSIFATVWGSVETLSGREIFQGQQITAEVTHRVTIRWREGVGSDMNVAFDGRMYQVKVVLNPDGVHKKLELLCIERADSANEQPDS